MKKQKGNEDAPEWMHALLREIDSINPEEFKPVDEAGQREHVVGVVSEGCKKLYALAKKYKKSADEARRTAFHEPFLENSLKKEFLADAHKKQKMAEAVMGIFQASIRDAHNLWGKDIGIRKGWTIVRIAIDEVPATVRFFEGGPFKTSL